MLACMQMHVTSTVVRLPSSVDQKELHAAIDAACANPEIDGVLVQLPLPPHLNEYDVMERVDPRKDVDGFHPLNMGRMLARNAPPRFVPATALGCMQLLKRYNISVTVRLHCSSVHDDAAIACVAIVICSPVLEERDMILAPLSGAGSVNVSDSRVGCMQKKHVVVLGDSNIVGTPLSVLLRDAGAGTVTVCHRIAYNNLFDDRTPPCTRTPQLRADACLPRLPGPYSAEMDPKGGTSPWLSTPVTGRLPCLDEDSVAHSSASLEVRELASGATCSLGWESD